MESCDRILSGKTLGRWEGLGVWSGWESFLVIGVRESVGRASIRRSASR